MDEQKDRAIVISRNHNNGNLVSGEHLYNTFLTLNIEKPYKCTYCIGEECQMEQKCTFGHDEKKTMTWQIRGGE